MTLLLLIGLLGAPAAMLATPGEAPAPTLELPIACAMGSACFVQQYADHDPGPGAKDHRCGERVYDGHDGTDLRVATLAKQRRGVAVLAAAAGIVRGVRNGETDRLIDKTSRASIAGRECGNGVVIAHPGGWETQYCHMARGSVAVKAGQAVRAGEAIGRVGLSGDTQFPHLHFSVRQGAAKVDPFAAGAPAGSCRAGRSLWSAKAAAALAYRDTEFINAGFASAPLTMSDIEEERVARAERASPALLFYARAIGLQAGDVLRVGLRAPDGSVVATSDSPMNRAKAQYFAFAGRKRPPQGWAAGRYTGEGQVIRSGRVVARGEVTITL